MQPETGQTVAAPCLGDAQTQTGGAGDRQVQQTTRSDGGALFQCFPDSGLQRFDLAFLNPLPQCDRLSQIDDIEFGLFRQL